jgi:hypothetical protein
MSVDGAANSLIVDFGGMISENSGYFTHFEQKIENA